MTIVKTPYSIPYSETGSVKPETGKFAARKILHFLLGFMCWVCILCPAYAQNGDITEIVVTGRQPGPPLWRVTNDENILWILPLLSRVPKDMIWEDDKVAVVIAGAEEAIGAPDLSIGFNKLIFLNPVNVIRGVRLNNRIQKNPGGKALEEVLPGDIYERYAALKAGYFPRNQKIDRLRPSFAADVMEKEVLAQEQLTGPDEIIRQVQRLIRRNRSIRETEVRLERDLEGNFSELRERAENMTESYSMEFEIGCFEARLSLLERHLNDMKEVANAWATGNASEIDDYTGYAGLEEDCAALLLTSSEGELIEGLHEESLQHWLDAATLALENNSSTFSMLPMTYITGELSLLERLAEMGYQIHTPK